ncbi:NAD(P)-binding protein [Alkalicoccus halolimnae]|uniref:precorrin-2 dehydrogenase n=1 Tax=Alkalicoccus halolimnae TaxID=1667239 RepID=A0A5C7F7Y6_9BACI|nr:NAD(P)-binding protein [Alkalicoccus halolimnae]TXF86792.1 NAD(P)-binding protein [Alkalicoccus halolimnae]
MASIPLMVNLDKKKIVIVGGGRVALKRIAVLNKSEAFITVISPHFQPEIKALEKAGFLTCLEKAFAPDDISDAFLVIIATDNPEVNESVRNAAPANCLLNDASSAESGSVQFPAAVKRGRLTIAVSTEGASPKFAKHLKKELSERYNEDYEAYMEFLFTARQLLKKADLSFEEKDMHLQIILSKSYLDPREQEKKLLQLRDLL